MSKHIQPTQRTHQAHSLDARRCSIFGIPLVQPCYHNRDGFDRHEGFETSNDPPPTGIRPGQTFSAEETLVEKESMDDGAKDTIELIVGFETLDDVLEERFDFCRGELIGGGCRCSKEWCRE